MTHTFLPWFRQGIANFLTPPTADYPFHATVALTATFEGGSESAQAGKTFTLAGPGEIAGIIEGAIIRTEPKQNNQDFEWNYLPFVEFYDEDFPWRYTPSNPDSNNRLLPWLSLMVVENNPAEFSWGSKPLTVILKGPVLQTDPAELWAWAHTQVVRDASEQVAEVIKKSPHRSLSRILSPRRLDGLKSYEAFLVPTFERGRLAGLGDSAAATTLPSLFSWKKDTKDAQEFPYYYHWSFSTGEAGDVETLVRKLKPNSMASVSLPKINIQALAKQLSVPQAPPPARPPAAFLEMPLLLQPAGKTVKSYGEFSASSQSDKAVLNRLSEWLNPKSGDAKRAAWTPIYGKDYALPPPFLASNFSWKHVLNLDPRYRAYANLGAEIVRQNQESFVKFATDNATELLAANTRIRQAAIAAEIGKSLVRRHIEPLLNNTSKPEMQNRAFAITSALHVKAGAINSNNPNLAAELSQSRIVRASLDPKFRKVASQINRRLPDIAALETLMTRMDEDKTASAPEMASGARYKKTLDIYYGGVKSEIVNNSVDPKLEALLKPLRSWATRIQPEEGARPKANLSARKQKLNDAIEPVASLRTQINAEFQFTDTSGQSQQYQNNLTEIFFTAEYPHPVFNYLKEVASHVLQPEGIENSSAFPENSVSLLEINQAVVEAIMVGVNAEIANELNWRGIKTEKGDSFFRNFWETFDSANQDLPEIKPINTWSNNSNLGDLAHREPAAARPEFLICLSGEVFRKLPDLNIYLRPAKASSTGSVIPFEPNEQGVALLPILHGQLSPGVTCLGFNKTLAEVTAGAGYFVVLEQRPGSARFGLDETSKTTSPVSIDNLSWSHFPDFKVLGPLAIFNKTTGFNANGNAATIAKILFQKPVQLNIHLSSLLPS